MELFEESQDPKLKMERRKKAYSDLADLQIKEIIRNMSHFSRRHRISKSYDLADDVESQSSSIFIERSVNSGSLSSEKNRIKSGEILEQTMMTFRENMARDGSLDRITITVDHD